MSRSGVDYIGFPFRLDFHAEDTSEEEAADIILSLPKQTQPVLITYLNKAEDIRLLMDKMHCNVVQLHGDIDLPELKKLRAQDSDIAVIKSIIINNDDIDVYKRQVDIFAGLADAYITDTFDPATGAKGATGKTHNWDISAAIREYSPQPLILAGGITPDNVYAAIKHVKPAGIDCHTGVEDSTGRKDKAFVEKFVNRARKAFESEIF